MNLGSPGPESLPLTSMLRERQNSKFKILGGPELWRCRGQCGEGSVYEGADRRGWGGRIGDGQLMQGLGGRFPEASTFSSGNLRVPSLMQACGFPPASRIRVALGAAPSDGHQHLLCCHPGHHPVLLLQYPQVSPGLAPLGCGMGGNPLPQPVSLRSFIQQSVFIEQLLCVRRQGNS